jgi:pimeloyl-ACP methyl ester carboxylesterase
VKHRRTYRDDLLRERPAGQLNVAVGGDPDAPPVLLVHGLSGTWRAWRPTIAGLIRDHFVVAVDLPGFGYSEAMPGPGFDVDDVAGLIGDAVDVLGIDKHVVIGHSLGGAVSVAYCSTRVQRVPALGLIAPAGFLRYPGYVRVAWRSETLHRAGRYGTRIAEPLLWMSGKARHVALHRIMHDPTRMSARDLVHMARGSSLGRATAAAGSYVAGLSLYDRLPALTMPTMVLWGERDRVVPPFRAEEVADALPNLTELVMVPEVGHLPMWEDPPVTNAAIRRLLEHVDETSDEDDLNATG